MFKNNIKEIKQNYLKKEIIDKGYDASKFVDFLTSKKEDGSNIDLWDFEELKVNVKEFHCLINSFISKDESKIFIDESINLSTQTTNNLVEIDCKTMKKVSTKIEKLKIIGLFN